MRQKLQLFLLIFFLIGIKGFSQEAYFVDGFHGGIWGHYPKGYTEYIISQMEKNPHWKLNLEIEPETWDRVANIDIDSYNKLQAYFEDQSVDSRVEYVNPTYGQAYMFNISGESIIRQFSYGIKKLKNHFPNITFNTYSSEEPCFTSALPQILLSYGINNASLKNPNTCWGGYTRAHGGELVNWIGPDGSSLVTVPRYKIENLTPGSTWETIGNSNSLEYINAAFNYGIESPVGMCLQDAGWELGPWLKGKHYNPSIYTTWHHYFSEVANPENITDWNFNQEDVLVSLVWGSQVLQKIAQQVRVAENNLLQAEKIAVMQNLGKGKTYPTAEFDRGWEELLLAQHHDCWIVPYNGKSGDNWADKVVNWTKTANAASANIIENDSVGQFIKIYNSSGFERNELVSLKLSKDLVGHPVSVADANGLTLGSQRINEQKLLFRANIPSYGYKVFQIKKGERTAKDGASINKNEFGDYLLDTNLYKLKIDGKSGTIKSLIGKKLDGKEFIDQVSSQKFNSLRGNFFNKGFRSNIEEPAKITILENGKDRIKISIETLLVNNPVIQTITLSQNEPRIDFKLHIDWQENIGIGDFKEKADESNPLRKAFYNDKYKLLNLFPLNLKDQKVFKNAPFDVMQSQLDNTFFDSWDSIKNNIILDWVDVTDGEEKYGCALFSDHTTTYAHAKDFPLALNVQYSGKGLWGQNYTLKGPTEINYSLLPHKGNWRSARIWKENQRIKEPFKTVTLSEMPEESEKSFLSVDKSGWILSSVYQKDGDTFIRIFNAEGDENSGRLNFGFDPGQVTLMELNGREIGNLQIKEEDGNFFLKTAMPQFGFRTLKINIK